MIVNKLVKKLHLRYSKEQAHVVAWWLVEALTKKGKLELLTTKYTLSDAEDETLEQWIYEHVEENKPLQYIIGSLPFGSLTIEVNPPTLIPRPETEEWCAQLIESLKNRKDILTILDMCTGSGCIGLWLAREFPKAHVYAVDISEEALTLAKKNATLNKIFNITFVQSDLFKNLKTDLKFDLIVSNPPYISAVEWDGLEPVVKNWEDRDALVAENEGLELIEKIVSQALAWLTPNGNLYIEIGSTQSAQVKQIFKKNGFETVTVISDGSGKERVVAST